MDRNLRIRMLLEAGDKVSRPLRDIAGGSARAAQALKATRDRLKDIERVQGELGEFRSLKAGLRSTGERLDGAKAKVAALAREMATTDAPTKKLAAEFARAKREAASLGREHDGERVRLQHLRDRLAAAGIATSDLVRHERALRDAAARTNAELTEQQRRLTQSADRAARWSAARERFDAVQGRAVGMAAGGAAAIGTGVALARPIVAGVKAAQEFESTMTDIGQKADLSRRQSALLGVELLKASRAANQLPEAMQAGVDTLTGFGAKPAEAVAMMRPIGRAATAYKAEIADLSAAAFAANDNLKVPVAQTQRVIDIMAQAGKSGAFEIKDMAGAFPALTAGYQALGQKGVGAVADLAAALQVARKGAGDSATAATNVANIIQKIGSPQTIKAFSKFGIDLPNALKKAYAEGKTPLEAIAELTAKATKGDLGKIGFLFEDAQVQQGLRPIIQNFEEYRRIRAEAAGAGGTTDRDFAERMQDSAEQSKALATNAKVLGITLGSMLLPTVNAVTSKLVEFASWTSGVAQRHPTLTKAVVIAAAVLAGFFVLFGIGAIAIAGIMGPIAILNAGLIAMGVAGGTASIGLLPIIGTVLLIVAAIALLAAGAYLIYKNWGAITGFFGKLWDGVKAGAFATFAFLFAFPARCVEIGKQIVLGLIGGITGMLGKLKDTIVGAASAAANWFKQKLGIHSPSRLFAGFGGFLMEGLDRGIAAGARAPLARVDRVAAGLAAGMAGIATPALSQRLTQPVQMLAPIATPAAVPARSEASADAPARQGGATSIVIHVYGAPGQSAGDLGRAVADELDRRERAAGAQVRSSYDDTPDWR